MSLDNVVEWETKTLTSAIKTFFRSLPEPLMTFQLHSAFINAASELGREEGAGESRLVGRAAEVTRCSFNKW